MFRTGDGHGVGLVDAAEQPALHDVEVDVLMLKLKLMS